MYTFLAYGSFKIIKLIIELILAYFDFKSEKIISIKHFKKSK